MPLYPNVDVVIAYGYWLDEATRAGVAVDNRTPATVTLAPVDHDGTTTATPNLRDPGAHGWLKTRTRTARVDPATGYFAAVLVATNDPDLDAYPGRQVTFSGEKPFVVQVPYNAPTVSATSEMVTALAGAVPGLTAGQQVKAMPLVDAAVTSPAPTPALAYLTATQTLTTIATAIDVHDTDPDAHADIRALIAQGGVADATTSRKGIARLLGGTASNPTIPYGSVTGVPTALPPTGGAGGVLSGQFPNPGFAQDMATQAEADAGDTATAAAAATDASSKVAAHRDATDPHGDRAAAAAALTAHNGDTTNPHAVTKTQVGLGNVANLAPADLPVSTAAQVALDALSAGVPEQARDALGAALVAGTNVTIVPNDNADTITISATGGGASGTTVPTRTASSNTTAAPGELLVVDATSGQRIITPPAAPTLGTFVTVLKSDATSNYVVWDGATNSDTSAGLVRQWAGATFTWLGSVWAVTAANLTSAGQAPLTQRSPAATTATTAAANEIVPLDTSSGTFTLTGPASGAPFGARWKAGTAAPTIAAPSGYTISGVASISMGLAPGGSSGELVVWQAFGTDYQPVAGFKPQTALAAAFDTKGSAAAAQTAAATDATNKVEAHRTATDPHGDRAAAASALATHAATTTNVHGILDAGDLYRPSLRLPRWPVPTQVATLFQPGHGFTANGTGVTAALNDSSTFVKGVQSATVTSGGTGTQANLDNFAVSALDLTGKLIRLTFKVDDITNLASINFFLGTSSLANNFRWRVQTTTSNSVASNYIQSGEWVTITLGWADVASASGTYTYSNGSPSSRTGFTNVRCQIIDNNTASPVTVHWQAIEIIPDGSTVFPNGVVSIGFDDSWQSVYTLARPRLDQYGYGATMWTITDLVGSGAPRVTLDSLLSLQDRSGWEIGAHAYQNSGHSSTDTGMTAAQLDTDARNQKAWLVGNGFYGEGHAYPQGRFGKTSDNVTTQSVIRKYFAYGRTILYGDTVETFPPADPYKLRALSGVSSVGTNRQLPTNITSAGGLLDRVKNNQGWLILVFHELIASGTPSATTVCTQADFNTVVDAVASRGMPCLPVGDVLRYYSP